MMKSALTKKPKTVEALASALEALRQEETQALQKLGVCEVDGLDTSDAEAVLHQIEGRIRALDAALTVARQKDDAAQAELKQAEQQVQREHLRGLLMQLQAVGHQIDKRLDDLKRVVQEQLVPLLNETRALGHDSINQPLNVANLSFKVRLLESCRVMPGCATAEAWFLKPEPWSCSLPAPDQADQVTL